MKVKGVIFDFDGVRTGVEMGDHSGLSGDLSMIVHPVRLKGLKDM